MLYNKRSSAYIIFESNRINTWFKNEESKPKKLFQALQKLKNIQSYVDNVGM